MNVFRYRAVPCESGSAGVVICPLDLLNGTCKADCYSRVSLRLKDGDKLPYRPGDSVDLFACNNEADVSWLLRRMDGKVSPDQFLILKHNLASRKSSPGGPPVDIPITPRFIIRHHLELHSLASRKTIRLLATCCSNEDEKRILLKMGTREGAQLYDKLIKKTSATIMDLLTTFSSCSPSLETMLELFPPLAARPYSLIDE
ncbi:unnamed protein product, partial [Hydatigera taeniaeformis]|uniref:FAD_binding_1 domain-containing protein n=1 Tax=Hydatigena taeniaeformis TaxID=6205 RepID=A0A0R3WVM8_HYDTA